MNFLSLSHPVAQSLSRERSYQYLAVGLEESRSGIVVNTDTVPERTSILNQLLLEALGEKFILLDHGIFQIDPVVGRINGQSSLSVASIELTNRIFKGELRGYLIDIKEKANPYLSVM